MAYMGDRKTWLDRKLRGEIKINQFKDKRKEVIPTTSARKKSSFEEKKKFPKSPDCFGKTLRLIQGIEEIFDNDGNKLEGYPYENEVAK